VGTVTVVPMEWSRRRKWSVGRSGVGSIKSLV